MGFERMCEQHERATGQDKGCVVPTIVGTANLHFDPILNHRLAPFSVAVVAVVVLLLLESFGPKASRAKQNHYSFAHCGIPY